jgi:ribosomal protein L24
MSLVEDITPGDAIVVVSGKYTGWRGVVRKLTAKMMYIKLDGSPVDVRLLRTSVEKVDKGEKNHTRKRTAVAETKVDAVILGQVMAEMDELTRRMDDLMRIMTRFHVKEV